MYIYIHGINSTKKNLESEMSTPAAKRRRLDAAQTLSKPFRSPFKTPFKSPLKTHQDGTNPTPLHTSVSFSNGAATPLADKSTNALLSHPSNTPKLRSAPPSLLSNRSTMYPTPRGRRTFTSPLQTALLNADPDIAPLLKTQRDLERQLREAKEELEAAEQAGKIERESREGEVDGELVELIEKWRGASRMAAEELFGKVRDRVNRLVIPVHIF